MDNESQEKLRNLEIENIDNNFDQRLSSNSANGENISGNVNGEPIGGVPSKRTIWSNIPNYLTFFRLALVPVFVVLMHDPSQGMVVLAIAVFITAAITDYVDGIIARKLGAISDFGTLLDPLVDKVLVMAALVMLVSQRSDIDGSPWVPGWMVVLVLARELWVTGLRAVAAAQGIIVAARATGKMKSGLQMVAIVMLLLHEQTISIFGTITTYQFIGWNLLFLSILFSYWSAYEYTHAILLEEREVRTTRPTH